MGIIRDAIERGEDLGRLPRADRERLAAAADVAAACVPGADAEPASARGGAA
jgi:hypothetical protein